MKIGIHPTKDSFSDRWIAYCENNHIEWKPVDCYRADLIQELNDCDSLMWHFSQNSRGAVLFARQLIYSVEASGKKVFPDFNSVWHFDDKVGQKYLLEALSAPLAPTWIFYNKKDALEWAEQTEYPKVFKLRGGAGSQNVRLVRDRRNAERLIRKAFNCGFPAYDPYGSLKERWRMYRLGKTNKMDLVEGLARFLISPPYSLIRGKERGYIYFQEFISGNDHDIRVIVIGKKAFAIKRMVRKNDFRASGSGNILYQKDQIDEATIKLAFGLSDRLKAQCVAFDFVYKDAEPLLVEINYGFAPAGYDPCPGYWDNNLKWHEGGFNPYGWIVEDLVSGIMQK